MRHQALVPLAALLLVPIQAGAAEAAGPVARGTVAWGSDAALVTDGQPPGSLGSRPEQPSADGRYVSFATYDALVPEDTNPAADVYVRDVETGGLRWVSRGVGGSVPDGHSSRNAISASGRYVTWISTARNLVPGDTNGVHDVFLRDLVAGTTVRVNVSSAGAQADQGYQDLEGVNAPSVSDDGTVAFTSAATNLVPDDTNRDQDVFVHSVRTGATVRASLSRSGGQLRRWSDSYAMSDDARCVAFTTPGGAVVPRDGNGSLDVFVRDLVRGTTTLVSARPDGATAAGISRDPSLSADCSTVSFSSTARSLAPGDPAPSRVYVRDLRSGTTVAASTGPGGYSLSATLSGDGTLVAFVSTSPQAPGVPDDRAARSYVRDLTTGTTQLLVVGPGGGLPSTVSPVLSADGRSVSFTTGAALVPQDVTTAPQGLMDVYVVRCAP